MKADHKLRYIWHASEHHSLTSLPTPPLILVLPAPMYGSGFLGLFTNHSLERFLSYSTDFSIF